MFFGAVADHAVEAALAFAAGIAVGDHLVEQRPVAPDGVIGIALAAAPPPGIRPHGAGGRGRPDRAGRRCRSWECRRGRPMTASASSTREAAFGRFQAGALQPEDADPVGDEARRVPAPDDAFAQAPVGEIGQRLKGRRPPGGPGDDFQQAHVARRIEEMRDGEVARGLGGQAFDKLGERHGRGVGAEDRPRPLHRQHAPVEGALDLQVLDHRLDDPVAILQAVEMILDIARPDQPGIVLMHERGGIGLGQALDGRLGDQRRAASLPWEGCPGGRRRCPHWRSGRRSPPPSPRRR